MAVRAVVLAVLALALFVGPLGPSPAAAKSVDVLLVASGLAWHSNSSSEPAAPTIVVYAGYTLHIQLQNDDAVTHTFTFPHFGVDRTLSAVSLDNVNIPTTPADEGVWQFWCTPHSAGADPESHTGMVGWFDFQPAPPDTSPPDIAHTPPAGPVETGTAILIEATVTDDVAVQSVHLNYTDVSSASQNVTMTLQGDLYVATIPAQPAAGTVTYFLHATDTSGNANTTGTFSVTVQAATPPPNGTPTGANYAVWIVVAIVLVAAILFALLYARRKKAT